MVMQCHDLDSVSVFLATLWLLIEGLRSLVIAHATSYSSLIETMRLSCTVFEIQRVI